MNALIIIGALAIIWLVVKVLWATWEDTRERARLQKALAQIESGNHSRWKDQIVLVVVNPIGGARRAERILERIVKPMLTKAGVLFDCLVTRNAAHPANIINEVDITAYQAILCISGDGMLHELLNSIFALQDTDLERFERLRKVPLAVIPGGTGNGIAASFGVWHPVDAVLLFLNSEPKPLDLMRLDFEHPISSMTNTATPPTSSSAGTRRPVWTVMCCNWGDGADHDRLTEITLRRLGPLRNVLVPIYLIFRMAKYHARLHYLPFEEEEGRTGRERADDDDKDGSVLDDGDADADADELFRQIADRRRRPSQTGERDVTEQALKGRDNVDEGEESTGVKRRKGKEERDSGASSVSSRRRSQRWRTLEGRFPFMTLCALPYVSHDMMMAPKAKIDDGAIDVVVCEPGMTRMALLWLFLACVEKGKHYGMAWVGYYKVKRFVLEPLQTTGEALSVDGQLKEGTGMFSGRVVRNAATFIY